MNGREIPQWLSDAQRYEPRADRDGFLDRTILGLSALCARMASSREKPADLVRVSPEIMILSLLLVVLFISLSRGFTFVSIVMAAELAVLSSLDAERILRSLKTAASAAAFAACVMFPSLFLSGPAPFAAITLKTCASVTALSILSGVTRWDTLTEGMRILPVPGIFILVIDITVRYISLLGDLAVEMFRALKLRSVGRNEDKRRSLAGIAGGVFISSRGMAEDLYAAMACRGFSGEYALRRWRRISLPDVFFITADAGLIALFVIYGGII